MLSVKKIYVYIDIFIIFLEGPKFWLGSRSRISQDWPCLRHMYEALSIDENKN